MTIKTYLTAEEIKGMIDKASCLRDKVIISFLADAGTRLSELLRLKVENLDLESGLVLIPHLKRGIRKHCPGCGKSAGRNQAFCVYCGEDLSKVVAEGIQERKRVISIGKDTIKLLREYVEELSPSEVIIQLSRQRVYYLIRDLAEAVGVSGKAILNPETGKQHYVHPHSFRDSLAIEWLQIAGTDVNKQKALQVHLGHQSFDTTMRYNKLRPTAVRKVSDEVRKKRFG